MLDLNRNLIDAKINKKDEFYTQLLDIEAELQHYKKHFKDKVIYCNCDDWEKSNFTKYFKDNFKQLGLNKLIATCWVENGNGELFEYNGSDIKVELLKGDGDFRSKECIELLKQADIVVTNPPFSLFREYIQQLIEYKKKFLIIGNLNAVTYKDIFPLIKENKIWFGINNGGSKWFRVQDHYDTKTDSRKKIVEGKKYFSLSNINWFTNLSYSKRSENLILDKSYKGNEFYYPKYENYNAINVNLVKEIPKDYKGLMGVPITFLDKHNPKQFEIVSLGKGWSIDFSSNRKMEILDKKTGKPTGKFTRNAKGVLYRLYNPNTDLYPAFRDCENKKLYSSIYVRIIIRRI